MPQDIEYMKPKKEVCTTETSVFVRHRFAGLHRWKTIPIDHPKQFLKEAHRHLFHVELEIRVSHNDRDVEFLVLKDTLADLCTAKYADNKIAYEYSCENIAEYIFNYFSPQFSVIMVEVSEDGENGARVKKC